MKGNNVELEFKQTSMLIDAISDYGHTIVDRSERLAKMGIPANHPIAYKTRQEVRDMLVLLDLVQTEYSKLHNGEDCSCGKTPDKIQEQLITAREGNAKMVQAIDDMEKGMEPMDTEDSLGPVLMALIDAKFGDVYGDDGPDFTVVDLGGYL